MAKNENKVDQIIRVVAGVVLIVISFFWLPLVWQIAGYIIGVFLIITGATGFCLIYKLLGIDGHGSQSAQSSVLGGETAPTQSEASAQPEQEDIQQ